MRLPDSAPGEDFPPPDLSSRVHGASYFFLRKAPGGPDALTVVCGGRERCNRDYVIRRSRFPYFGIEWVERGAGTVKLDGRRWDLRPGSVFAYGPRTDLEIVTAADQPMTKVFLDLRGREVAGILARSRLAPGSTVLYPQVGQLSELFDSLAGSIKVDHAGMMAIAVEYLRLLLLKIKLGQSDESHASIGPDYDLYLRGKRLIAEHARELATLAEVCARLQCSRSYICRLFQRFDTTSPYQFLLRAKISLALEPLSQENALVKQVAAAAGYADSHHFSRVFKKIHGMSPAAMQRLLRRG